MRAKLIVLVLLFSVMLAAGFRVDNNEPPTCQLGAVEEEVFGDIYIPYTLMDRESDTLSILCEYSLDGGETWINATVKNQVEGLTVTEYAGDVIWDSIADIDGLDAPDVVFHVIPSDNDSGEAGSTD